MATHVKKKSVNQEALRQLMKERQSALKSDKKIDSPLAKYNSLGQLSCIACKTTVKNETLWTAHTLGRTHKENLEKIKTKNEILNNISVKRKANEPVGIKTKCARVHLDTQNGKEEIMEKSTNNSKQQIKPKVSSSLIAYESSDDESDMELEAKNLPSASVTSSELPPNFLDSQTASSLASGASPIKNDTDMDVEGVEEKNVAEQNKPNCVEALPEGFFDDPVLDAKVRKVEYKDPMEEEWKRFQKTILEESNVSQAIIEKDLEEANVERDIDEIDEQIYNWSRVEALQQKKDYLMQQDEQKARKRSDSDTNSSADEQEFDEFLDWRAKRTWKR